MPQFCVTEALSVYVSLFKTFVSDLLHEHTSCTIMKSQTLQCTFTISDISISVFATFYGTNVTPKLTGLLNRSRFSLEIERAVYPLYSVLSRKALITFEKSSPMHVIGPLLPCLVMKFSSLFSPFPFPSLLLPKAKMLVRR